MCSFSAFISLGEKCQTSFQIRRTTNESQTSYFDWLGSPHAGLMTTLRRDFKDCFRRDQLTLTADRKSVVNQETGITYRHCFTRNAESGLIDPETLNAEFDAVRQMLDRRADRFRKSIRNEKLLFIRHAETTANDGLELFEMLTAMASGNPIDLLLINPPGQKLGDIGHRIHLSDGIPLVSDENRWQGIDQLWDQELKSFLNQRPARCKPPSRPFKAITCKPRRILFQVSVRYSLGHLNRMVAIAHEIKREAPATDILFAIEGHFTNLTQLLPYRCIVLPESSSSRPKDPSLEPRFLLDRHLSRKICRAILDSFKPQLIVFDCFPNRCLLDGAYDLGIATTICIKNLANEERFLEKQTIRRILSSCVSVIVPHESEDITVLPSIRDKSVFVGSICADLSGLRSTPKAKGRSVVITPGAGGHKSASRLMEDAIQAFTVAHDYLDDLRGIVIPGPLCRSWPSLPARSNLIVLPPYSGLLEHCASADLVISPAGYTLLNELSILGTPTIAIPQTREFDDQHRRVKQWSHIWPNIHNGAHADADGLSSAIVTLIQRSPARKYASPPRGAIRAASHLLRLLEDL